MLFSRGKDFLRSRGLWWLSLGVLAGSFSAGTLHPIYVVDVEGGASGFWKMFKTAH